MQKTIVEKPSLRFWYRLDGIVRENETAGGIVEDMRGRAQPMFDGREAFKL